MSVDYEKISDSIIKDTAEEDIFLTRLDAALSIQRVIDPDAFYRIEIEDVNLGLSNNSFTKAVRVSFHGNNDANKIDVDQVDLVLSDCGCFVSDRY